MRHTGTNAAQLDLRPEAGELVGSEPGAFADPLALRQQVAERVAAHRARRGGAVNAMVASGLSPNSRPEPRAARSRHAQIAGAVAERYAQAESYRNFLAAEAERSVRQAEAVAEVATINARAIADAQQQMLADLDHWDLPADPRDPQTTAAVQTGLVSAATANIAAAGNMAFPHLAPPAVRAFTVRLPEELAQPPLYANGSVIRPQRESPAEIDLEEVSALDDEIAFRHAPAAPYEPLEELPLSANLIEFPRQLVASRKVRPRLAEGPLRDEAAAEDGQLRIFEVEAAQLEPATATTALPDSAPEWSSILLASHPAAEFVAHDSRAFTPTLVPQVAPISRRLMAALVDGSIVLATLAAAAGVFVQTVVHLSPTRAALELKLPAAALAGGIAAASLGALYLLLFFTFSDSTPGMRFARIALCTFSDSNPTRAAMRRRLLSLLFGAVPLGLGLLWAFLDEDTLAWHDRLSRMYQRSY